MRRTKLEVFVPVFVGATLVQAGCMTVNNSPGRPAYYVAPGEPYVSTLNVDSQDIIEAARSAVPDMLANPDVMAVAPVPRVAVDANEFENLSFDPVATKALTGLLKNELLNAARGRLMIIDPPLGRHDGSARGADDAPVDYDLCLAGEITSTRQPPDAAGRVSSSFHINFRLYRPGTRQVIWSKTYLIKKGGQVGTIYR